MDTVKAQDFKSFWIFKTVRTNWIPGSWDVMRQYLPHLETEYPDYSWALDPCSAGRRVLCDPPEDQRRSLCSRLNLDCTAWKQVASFCVRSVAGRHFCPVRKRPTDAPNCKWSADTGSLGWIDDFSFCFWVIYGVVDEELFRWSLTVKRWKMTSKNGNFLILLKSSVFYPIKFVTTSEKCGLENSFHGLNSQTHTLLEWLSLFFTLSNQINENDRIQNKASKKQFTLFESRTEKIQITFSLSADKVHAIGKRSQMSKPFWTKQSLLFLIVAHALSNHDRIRKGVFRLKSLNVLASPAQKRSGQPDERTTCRSDAVGGANTDREREKKNQTLKTLYSTHAMRLGQLATENWGQYQAEQYPQERAPFWWSPFTLLSYSAQWASAAATTLQVAFLLDNIAALAPLGHLGHFVGSSVDGGRLSVLVCKALESSVCALSLSPLILSRLWISPTIADKTLLPIWLAERWQAKPGRASECAPKCWSVHESANLALVHLLALRWVVFFSSLSAGECVLCGEEAPMAHGCKGRSVR